MILKKIKYLLLLMRPSHWVKNLFLFLPIFFAGKLEQLFTSLDLWYGFVTFSLAASTVYIFNDFMDVEEDKKHPEKKHRPFAAGKISKPIGSLLGFLLAVIAIIFSFFIEIEEIIIGYILLNIFYTLYLKKISLLDVSIISVGFVLRVLAGGIIANIFISKWIIIMTFLLAICLAFGKRRDELIIANKVKQEMKTSLSGYTLEFLNLCLVSVSVIIIVCYILYGVSPEVIERMGTDKIYLTSFFVILGIFRFLQIVIVEEKSGSPTNILLQDKFLQCVLFGWIVSFTYLIYFL